MLKQRVITALVLIPVVFWLVLFADTQIFTYAMMLVIGIAGYEWAMLSGLDKSGRYLFAGSLIGLMLFGGIQQWLVHTWALTIYSLTWLVLTLLLINQKKELQPESGISFVSVPKKKRD